MKQNCKKPVGWHPAAQLLDVKDSNIFSNDTMNVWTVLIFFGFFFKLRAKVQCPHTGWRDSWKMLIALLCTRREKCQWWLMCSCETFQLKFNTLQPKSFLIVSMTSFCLTVTYIHITLGKRIIFRLPYCRTNVRKFSLRF